MSLANIKGKLNRAEMRNIMAGSGNGTCTLYCDSRSNESVEVANCTRETMDATCTNRTYHPNCNC